MFLQGSSPTRHKGCTWKQWHLSQRWQGACIHQPTLQGIWYGVVVLRILDYSRTCRSAKSGFLTFQFNLLTDSPATMFDHLITKFEELPRAPCKPLTSDILYRNAEQYLKRIESMEWKSGIPITEILPLTSWVMYSLRQLQKVYIYKDDRASMLRTRGRRILSCRCRIPVLQFSQPYLVQVEKRHFHQHSKNVAHEDGHH